MLEKEFVSAMPKLGFGLMRLPRKSENVIDTEEAAQMTDAFLAAGMKYFDTAYVYDGSEEACRKALVERHPRDSFYLADKLNASKWAVSSEEEAKKEFETSLERTGAGHFDFYLLHALSSENLKFYDSYGIWDFVKQKKAEGKIRHMGFSFHDTPEVLDSILTAHPEAEFVQLQLNYADWENPEVQSRKNYEVCVKHGKPVVVMEPVKGGSLANPLPVIAEEMKTVNPEKSYASWAIRFAASLPDVMVVLSGMSSLEQMNDNLSYMKDFTPLSEKEQEVLEHARKAMAEVKTIPCTACHYCTGGCPMHIEIPGVFKAVNRRLVYNDLEGAKRDYQRLLKDHGAASSCVHCGQCEDACPQHIEIRKHLEEAAAMLEG